MLRARAICRTRLSAVAGGAILLLVAPVTAQAQTATDINRANAALQLCMSPAGAAIAQCAQVKQQLGQQLGANGDAAAAAAASLLNGIVKSPGGASGLAGLLGAVAGQAAQANTAAPVGSGDYYNQATAATYNAAAAYQACVAANPANWQACLAQMNGGAAVSTVGLNLTGAALAGYQRCLQTNPADKCAKAYGASATAAAPAPAGGGNAVANAAAAAQAAKQLAPTVKALGALLGAR